MFSTIGVPSAAVPTLTAWRPATPNESLVDIRVCRRAMMAKTQSFDLEAVVMRPAVCQPGRDSWCWKGKGTHE